MLTAFCKFNAWLSKWFLTKDKGGSIFQQWAIEIHLSGF
jgi:hypothetical protein